MKINYNDVDVNHLINEYIKSLGIVGSIDENDHNYILIGGTALGDIFRFNMLMDIPIISFNYIGNTTEVNVDGTDHVFGSHGEKILLRQAEKSINLLRENKDSIIQHTDAIRDRNRVLHDAMLDLGHQLHGLCNDCHVKNDRIEVKFDELYLVHHTSLDDSWIVCTYMDVGINGCDCYPDGQFDIFEGLFNPDDRYCSPYLENESDNPFYFAGSKEDVIAILQAYPLDCDNVIEVVNVISNLILEY